MFFDTKDIEILPDGKEFILLRKADGSEIKKLRLKRLFPMTGGNAYIRMVNAEGKEAGIIKNLNELKPESRQHALNALNHFYIIPSIIEITGLHDAHGSLFWEVETDRGKRKFTVASRNRDITLFPSGKMIVRDTDDNQYEIADYKSMSAASRKLLEPWL